MNITEHEMRGLLTGKCLPGDMRVNEELSAYLVRKFAELKAERDAMAAENVALKTNLMFWDAEDPEAPYDHPEEIANNCAMELHTEFDVQVAAKMPNRTYRVSDVGDYDCTLELVSGGMPETPATDAYLNSVRADAVVKAAAHLGDMAAGKSASTAELIKSCGRSLLAFANQLRAGEPS